MTLMQIELVLHYYWSPEEHLYVVQQVGGARQAVDGLMDLGLLDYRTGPSDYSATYETTDKGKVYVEAVRNVPLPVQQWVMP
jgi:hypothetical protein